MGFRIIFLLCIYNFSKLFGAEELTNRRLPEEYDTVGGHSLGLANSGVATLAGISAVRMNPGLLPLEKTYSLNAGYNWPTQGREFYQAGIVDTTSSSIAAGVIFNGFTDDPGKFEDIEDNDSNVQRRLALGLGGTMSKLALGVNVQYLEAISFEDFSEVKGTTLGLGAATLLTANLRLGASVENLANNKVADYAPRIIRAGVGYIFGDGTITLHADFRQRDRVSQIEQKFESDNFIGGLVDREADPEIAKDNKLFGKPEQMFFGSFSAKVYDMIRLLGGYGQSINGPDRKTLAGGLAIVSGNMSLSYTASRPYLDNAEAHQAINAGASVKW